MGWMVTAAVRGLMVPRMSVSPSRGAASKTALREGGQEERGLEMLGMQTENGKVLSAAFAARRAPGAQGEACLRTVASACLTTTVLVTVLVTE